MPESRNKREGYFVGKRSVPGSGGRRARGGRKPLSKSGWYLIRLDGPSDVPRWCWKSLDEFSKG